MKIIGWNCRGLGNGPAVRSLLELGRMEEPDVLFLAETKMSDKELERRHVDVDVKEEDGRIWRLTGVYGESAADRKVGGADRPQRLLDNFREALESCELSDIGFEGDKFTWRNHSKEVSTYICERLDRATANDAWCEWFPHFSVLNGAPRHSDHRPVIVCTQGGIRRERGGDGGFRFEAWWLQEAGCSEEVQGAWEEGCMKGSGDVATALKTVAGRMSKWGKEVAGDLEEKLKQARRELERCMRAAVSEEKVREEAKLRCRVEKIEERRNTKAKQRSHVTWLRKGNRSTKYFMAVASAKKKANRVRKLKKEDGSEVKEGEELNNYVCSFFQELFTSVQGDRLPELIDKVQPRVTPAMRAVLEAEFTREEVKAALDHIGDLKAPGPDGMPSIVYKRHWHFMGDKVVEEVLAVLNGGAMPEGWNDTVVVLIPKVKNPDRIKDLRPISLCNVLYKLVSKVIANRLKLILTEIISDNQSAFVPGRLITDNVLIAYEVSHFLLNKKKGNEGIAAVKADMSKAYDRVEWDFLRAMLYKLGFGVRWTDLLMNCVTTVRYQIKLNGGLTEQFSPSRGLRQGDPASPYLFVICAEGLSALLHDAEESGRVTGVKICRTAPVVSHLLFADDSLLLMKANHDEAHAVREVLDLYENCSGQCINLEKSAIMFSPNTKAEDKRAVKDALQIQSESWSDRYLGLPVHVGKSRKKAFAFVKGAIAGRVYGWKERFIAKCGKETLVTAVAQAIPTFAMSCFYLTKTFCEELSSLLCDYWWSQQDKDRTTHWISWKKLTLPKAQGGLGFRDMHGFNLAMPSRQIWRLIQAPESLCARILQARYFPDGKLLEAKPRDGISYSWRSLLHGLQLFREGYIWRIGDGSQVNIWSDPWLPRPWSCGVITPRGANLLQKVSDLIDPITGSWDVQLVRDTFWPDDVKHIPQIPLRDGTQDFIAWQYDTKGVHSVKSAYKLQVQLERMKQDGGVGDSSHVPGILNNITDDSWKRRADEDGAHLFVKCKHAKEVWRLLEMEKERIELESIGPVHAVLDFLWGLDVKKRLHVLVFWWMWWSNRNKLRQGEMPWSADTVARRTRSTVLEYLEIFGKQPVKPAPDKWRPLEHTEFKINVDGSFVPEICAMSQAVHVAADLGIVRVELETDSQLVAEALDLHKADSSARSANSNHFLEWESDVPAHVGVCVLGDVPKSS
ncbi:uncharacterized protein [Aegilops tauschii subsp. strangulata]|uniref:uncharacterized protein n=1 Tax=Aegilops tauschii subsp. strangulata TaxID=200361 RepID=UPI000989F9CF|nr:uncharacterized protein LOC123493751 [Aegilops tauschii subsp. strangulata]